MDDNEARAIAEKRIAKQRVQNYKLHIKYTLDDDIFNQIQQGELKDLNIIIIKADVQGSPWSIASIFREHQKALKVRIVIVHA